MQLGPVGIWTFGLDVVPFGRAQDLVGELDEAGWGAVWVPETVGKEALVHAGLLLSATRRIVVATGIASIWGRDAVTMSMAHRTLTEAFPHRFLLGMGVSHAPIVEGIRGQAYERPYTRMREYLDAMDGAMYFAAPPSTEPQRVLAALGPRMLELAAERAAGAHPYFVPVEHTVVARQHLGPRPLLAPEQAVVLETDPVRARRVARGHMATYLDLPNYRNNLLRLGWDEADLADGGSDRLVDAIVAWGDEGAIAERVRAHLDAGADHVCVQVLGDELTHVPEEEWRRLAPALLP